MKAYGITNDPLSREVLKRFCDESKIFEFEAHEPTITNALKIKNAGDHLLFVDLDTGESLLPKLPQNISYIHFGSADIKAKVAPNLGRQMLLKPLSQAALQRAVDETMRSRLTIIPSQALPPAYPDDAVEAHWRQDVEAAVRRAHFRREYFASSPEQLRAKLEPLMQQSTPGTPALPLNVLPIKTALVVEPDNEAQGFVVQQLRKYLALQVDFVKSGRTAWKKIVNNNYDLIVLRWEIADPSGLVIYGRIRMTERYRLTPIIVTSSRLNDKEVRLFDEDSALVLVKPPLQEKNFGSALGQTFASAEIAKLNTPSLMEATNALLRSSYFSAAANLPPTIPVDVAIQVLKTAGDALLASEQYFTAEHAYAAAWNLGGRGMGLVTNYAKVSYLLGHHANARRLLRSANALAPGSIDRLCLMGEISLCMRDPDEARKRFQDALAIDQGTKKAKAGLVLADAMQEHEISQGGKSAPIQHFASHLNLIGIDLARSGRMPEAQRCYQAAMVFVREPDATAKLWFNLGICQLRARRSEEARLAFQKAYDISGGTMIKAANYLNKSAEDANIDSLAEETIDRRPHR